MGTSFQTGEQEWLARMGTLRQVVRQELVARQLMAHLPDHPPKRILDVGCGQGTQILRLAQAGHEVTGLDSSPVLLADLEETLHREALGVRARVTIMQAEAERLTELFGPASFDAVLCHGVLMYFTDPNFLLTAIARVVAPGGLVSLLVRNGDGLAMRPGLMGDWPTTLLAFQGTSYLNRIAVQARADSRHDLSEALGRRGLTVSDWYGVRVFSDTAPADAPLPEPGQLELLLEAEELAGRTDPYRGVAALTHLIAQRA